VLLAAVIYRLCMSQQFLLLAVATACVLLAAVIYRLCMCVCSSNVLQCCCSFRLGFDKMQSVLSKFVDARHQILLCNLKIGVNSDVFAKLSEASGEALLGWAWHCFKSHRLLFCCSGVGVVVADA
jgi:hypothetical protein